MQNCHLFLACIILGFVHSSPVNDNGFSELLKQHREGTNILDVTMPGITPKVEDYYVCTSVPVPTGENYIVQFEPLASGDMAHHMLMFGCEQPAENRKSWECGQTCRGKPNILFAWAKNAPPTNLPEDVGFKIGGSSNVRHIVLQIHYKNPTKEPDASGVRLHYTPERQKNIAGIALLLSTQISIPPHQPETISDISCQFKSSTPIYPFGFRTHAHSLGKVITGYQFNGTYHLIGKGNPQWPQAFYPVKDKIKISNNDILLGRCVFDSTHKDTYTSIGPTHNDEMCNFYMMYYTDANGGQPFYECFGNWRPDMFKNGGFPSQESLTALPPNPALEEEAEHGHSRVDSKADDKLDEEKLTPALEAVKNWPDLGNVKLGQVAGVATDSKGNVHIFHRADRVWDYSTFDPVNNQYLQRNRGPITQDTILSFNPNGKLIKQWGKNLFYLPHGLSIDDQDNIWVTDVAMHQVFKFNKGEEKPSLTLGKEFEPGNDRYHFCKPTDVAILPTGEFFVSDGYCNHRIIKYAADGSVIKSWGTIDGELAADKYPKPGAFKLPHGLTLAKDKKQVCVADRENGRIQCFDYDGNFKSQIHLTEFGHKVYAVAYTPHFGGLMYAINADQSNPEENEGFTIKFDTGKLQDTWKPQGGFSRPHDVAVSPDGKCVYVAEIGSNRVWKFHSTFDVGIHKSQKKMGNGIFRQKPDKPDFTTDEDEAEVDEMKKSGISKEVESNNEGSVQGENNATPIIVGVVLIVPVVVVIVATVIMRIRGRMAQNRLYTVDTGLRGGFNLGNLLGRKHKGFQQLNTEELDHLNSDSEDEFSRKT
ncbi:peptidyl-glycine alpha-amidating monooxygenase isoform X2 [Lingula anatina]|uniref:Peptidyl-glycine alpha-amidating monooxygenase isoform X2 n=1 Tax=Lingula anatina TaxID=7574 RepID=A0A1S3I9G3_LINAN|nr:peptidyl-glycine alpha-amidating monooxygenase isoform X2 [Lingula anatina]|eukprot:XP_013394833.1 peptidyl-glycine alpha-amidating monooxygenase isoform X2 [Lingula anatina]